MTVENDLIRYECSQDIEHVKDLARDAYYCRRIEEMFTSEGCAEALQEILNNEEMTKTFMTAVKYHITGSANPAVIGDIYFKMCGKMIDIEWGEEN